MEPWENSAHPPHRAAVPAGAAVSTATWSSAPAGAPAFLIPSHLGSDDVQVLINCHHRRQRHVKQIFDQAAEVNGGDWTFGGKGMAQQPQSAHTEGGGGT